jgi:choline dehydrogenase-like flavoprotein
MIRDLSASDDRELTANCGVCVIGGGIAGLIAASRLSASGRRVIVLESGDKKPGRQFDALDVVEQAVETYQNAVGGRVRALGGTSNTWGGRMMPLAPHDMAPRDYLGLTGWPIVKADLDRFLPDIERLFGLDARWSKWPSFRRRNVAHLLRDMIAIKRNPEIWLNATVCDLLVDAAAGRLAGVSRPGASMGDA